MAESQDPRKNATTMDQLVVGALTVISVALICGAIIRDDRIYLGYLAGPALLALIYFGFLRSDIK